ncbi:hypothetical protein Goshw_023267 [Gossypium schwendimanii]|uniref:RNase H type-1 domain-containing protein n=1 Tax=Gossypium schwendimanii TaxID=34291 RepID=A0A7J9NAI0_GOSSC|nr:hypothetical protein [Gossypium schwendimanii]
MKARRGITDRSVIGILIEDIRVMALNFIYVLFQHADRDSNTIAHTIAKTLISSLKMYLIKLLRWLTKIDGHYSFLKGLDSTIACDLLTGRRSKF